MSSAIENIIVALIVKETHVTQGKKGDNDASGFPLSRGLFDGSYWHRTDLIERTGQVPTCCGKAMSACDDHGRFKCWSCGRVIAV